MVTAVSISLVTLGVLAAYVAWVVGLHPDAAAMLRYALLLMVLYVAIVAAVTTLWFGIAWMHRARRPADVRLGLAGTTRLFLQELVTLMGNGWRMGFGWWLMREPRPPAAATRPAAAPPPVLLVHGVLCNAGVWLWMRAALQRRGIAPLYTISYGPPLASIDTFADQLARRIDTVVHETGAANVTLVGHSMGGLVARAYLRRHGSGRVAQVVTIATPYAGSVLARMFFGRSLAQLRRGSAWLAELEAAPRPDVPFTSIWSWHDSMVAPQDSSRLSWARNIVVSGIGHNALLRDERIADIVADVLRAEPRAAQAGATSGFPASAAQRPSARP